MSFPPGTEMFQFPGFAFYPYAFRVEYSTRCQTSQAGTNTVRSNL